MDHMYHFDTPRLPIDAGIIQFFESFYRVSDTPDAHDVYINHFTPDATFILASKVSNGIIGMYFNNSIFPTLLRSY